MHLVVRHKCIQYLHENADLFSAFVEDNGLGFDHYLYEMSRSDAWGGEVELQALSQLYQRDIVIYGRSGIISQIPCGVDINPQLLLCYMYGNHYDLVYPESQAQARDFCQGIVYGVLCRDPLWIPPPGDLSTAQAGKQNIDMLWWQAAKEDKEAADADIARILASSDVTSLAQPSPKDLLGFHSKGSREESSSRRGKRSGRSRVQRSSKLERVDVNITAVETDSDSDPIDAVEETPVVDTEAMVWPDLPEHQAPPPVSMANPSSAVVSPSLVPAPNNSNNDMRNTAQASDTSGGSAWGKSRNWAKVMATPPPEQASTMTALERRLVALMTHHTREDVIPGNARPNPATESPDPVVGVAGHQADDLIYQSEVRNMHCQGSHAQQQQQQQQPGSASRLWYPPLPPVVPQHLRWVPPVAQAALPFPFLQQYHDIAKRQYGPPQDTFDYDKSYRTQFRRLGRGGSRGRGRGQQATRGRGRGSRRGQRNDSINRINRGGGRGQG
eukprot:TRINITY_DN7385_c0_g1_i2.p1 TRINITY_DN7385_c0_g1~~TRINITY_DN7385_c0_g1_i2.p1  ORF type:complete len:543 (+),score=30.60 TRINITY_DN7385_c0_g1_i2:135-1631(+)